MTDRTYLNRSNDCRRVLIDGETTSEIKYLNILRKDLNPTHLKTHVTLNIEIENFYHDSKDN